jgi:hypothetical protein
MKFTISFLLMALLSFACLPLLALVEHSHRLFYCFCYYSSKCRESIYEWFPGFIFLWGGLSFWISYNNDHILAHKISMLIIKKDDPYLLMLGNRVDRCNCWRICSFIRQFYQKNRKIVGMAFIF